MANEFKVKNGLIVTGPTEIIASGSYLLSVDGFTGRLLQVDDGLQTGSIYSVNTVSGLPIIDVFANSTVRIGKFGEAKFFVSQSKVGIGKEGPLNGILDISGSVYVTGSINTSDTLTANTTNTINILVGKAAINSYSQINITNLNGGSGASSDIVATNDTGTETGNYVDLGINSSTFAGTIGLANDAYLYTTGSDFYIGNTTRGNKAVKFFSGNDATIIPLQVSGSTITAPSIYGNTTVTGSLDVSSTVSGLQLPNTNDAAGQVIGATAITDITGLTKAIGIGTYIIDAWVFGQSSTVDGAAFTVSSSATVTKLEIVHTGQTSTTALGATALQTTSNTVSTTYMTTQNAECFVHIAGKLITSTAGNVTIRGQKLVTGNLTIRSGSFMSTTKVA